MQLIIRGRAHSLINTYQVRLTVNNDYQGDDYYDKPQYERQDMYILFPIKKEKHLIKFLEIFERSPSMDDILMHISKNDLWKYIKFNWPHWENKGYVYTSQPKVFYWDENGIQRNVVVKY